MNISTRQLAGFVQASQLGSFTKAAERLNVTQAGLSAIIRGLEDQLGCRLFDRTTRTLVLDGSGTEVPAGCDPHREGPRCRLLRAGPDCTAGSPNHPGRSPRRWSPASCCQRCAACFRRTHPEVTVRILELQRDRIQELVSESESELDIGLGIFLKVAAGIERLPLLRSRLLLVSPCAGARRKSRRAVGRRRWEELRDAMLVALQPDNPVQQLIERHLRADANVHDARNAVNHIGTQIAMVEIGTGRAIIPSFAFACLLCVRDGIASLPRSMQSRPGRSLRLPLRRTTRRARARVGHGSACRECCGCMWLSSASACRTRGSRMRSTTASPFAGSWVAI